MADEQANQVHDYPRQFFAACARPNGSKTLPDFAAPPCTTVLGPEQPL